MAKKVGKPADVYAFKADTENHAELRLCHPTREGWLINQMISYARRHGPLKSWRQASENLFIEERRKQDFIHMAETEYRLKYNAPKQAPPPISTTQQVGPPISKEEFQRLREESRIKHWGKDERLEPATDGNTET